MFYISRNWRTGQGSAMARWSHMYCRAILEGEGKKPIPGCKRLETSYELGVSPSSRTRTLSSTLEWFKTRNLNVLEYGSVKTLTPFSGESMASSIHQQSIQSDQTWVILQEEWANIRIQMCNVDIPEDKLWLKPNVVLGARQGVHILMLQKC